MSVFKPYIISQNAVKNTFAVISTQPPAGCSYFNSTMHMRSDIQKYVILTPIVVSHL